MQRCCNNNNSSITNDMRLLWEQHVYWTRFFYKHRCLPEGSG